jgi:hypothetical protein
MTAGGSLPGTLRRYPGHQSIPDIPIHGCGLSRDLTECDRTDGATSETKSAPRQSRSRSDGTITESVCSCRVI